MNSRILIRNIFAFFLGSLAFLTVQSHAALINVDDTGTFFHPYSGLPGDRKWTLDSAALGGFDASSSDKLVLTFGGENQTSGYDEVSFGGTAMTRIVYAEPGGQDVAIWYLDNPGSGDLVVDLKAGNGIGLSVIALSGTLDGFGDTGVNAAGNSTSITTTGTNSLVVAASERNNNTSLPAAAPLIQVYSGDAGSSSHGSAYQQVPVSGTTITPTFPLGEGVIAAEFLSIPDLNWTLAGGGDGITWTDPNNWSGTYGTGSSMNIGTDTSDPGSVVLNDNFSAYAVNVGTEAGETSSLTLNHSSGKKLTVTSDVTVGADGSLKGNGTILGALVVDGGTVAPGTSPGTITVENGPATFNNGSTYDWEFGSISADLVAIDGNLVFDSSGGIVINALPLSAVLSLTTYDLFTFTGTFEDSIGNPITSANIGSYVTFSRGGDIDKWTSLGSLQVNSGAVQLVNFTYIPEPSTMILAGLGLAGLVLRRRRRGNKRLISQAKVVQISLLLGLAGMVSGTAQAGFFLDIGVANSDTFTANTNYPITGISSFNPLGASKIVVTLSTEYGFGDEPVGGATYDSVPMNLAVTASNSIQNTWIYYLDASEVIGGVFSVGDLVVTGSGNNDLGGSILALSNTVDGIALDGGSPLTNSAQAQSVALTTLVDGAIVVASHVNNGSSGTAGGDLTDALLDADVGSAGGGSGYAIIGTAGLGNYSFTGSTSRPVTVVAAFDPVFIPEPSTAILASLGLAGLMLRRRRGTK